MAGSVTRLQNILIVATHVAPASGYGGVAECTADLARAFTTIGREVHLVASDASVTGTISVSEVWKITRASVSLFRSRFLKRHGFGLGAIPLLWRAIGQADGVYIAGVSTWPVSLALIFCNIRHRPFSLGLHGGFMREHLAEIKRRKPLKSLFYRVFIRPLANRAASIHVMSLVEHDHAIGLFRAPLVIASLGVELAEINPAAPLPPLKNGGRRYIYVGRFSPEKSVCAMLRTWKSAAGPEDRLTIVGNGRGQYANEVRAACDDPRISIFGYKPRTEVIRILTEHDFLILPSGMEGAVRENFGIVVVEAMAVQRPVLVASGLSWNDVEAEGAGIVFEPTSDGLASALARASTMSTDEYARMAQRARSYVNDRADLLDQAARILESIDVVIDRPPRNWIPEFRIMGRADQ